MTNKSFKDYLKEKIKQKPNIEQALEKVRRSVEIAHQIYNLRKEKGLTQSELARIIGVSQSNIARIESADYGHYTMDTLSKVAKGLDADLNIFINPPEQTNKMIAAYNSYPTYQNFVFAGTSGEYFLSSRATFNSEEEITLGAVIQSEKVKFSTESKESKAEVNRFNFPTL